MILEARSSAYIYLHVYSTTVYSFLIWFCRMKCCQIWQPVVTLYKGWSVCQILYKYFTNTLQGRVSVPNVLITRHRTAGWCPGVERERGLNRFEFLSKGWNQPAGRQRIKEDTERDEFWLQTFKYEQWGQLNGPALRMNACWDLRPSPPLPGHHHHHHYPHYELVSGWILVGTTGTDTAQLKEALEVIRPTPFHEQGSHDNLSINS